MNSQILQIAAKYIRSILIVFALLALLRGHNYPGGGFIGGLLAALSIVYKGFAFDTKTVEKEMKIRPEIYIAFGLFVVLLSFLPSIVAGLTLMTGVWYVLPIPVLGDLKLGTPFLFDIGVFSVVTGVTLSFFFSLTPSE